MNRFINYYKKIFSQEYMDRTISGGIKSQLTLLLVTIATVLAIFFIIVMFFSIQLYGHEEWGERLWVVYNNFVDPGNQMNETAWSSRLLLGIVSFSGSILLGGVLISTISNIIERRVDVVNTGRMTYRNITQHYVLIGFNELTINMIRELYNECPSARILLMSGIEAATVRHRIQSALPVEIERQVLVYFGNIVKFNASISGAEVGCQGEVGVACAMASAAANQLFGGSPAQIEYAAEMGLEHHLGMTCDPVCGLVQIPCIERNAYAAARALDANLYSAFTDGMHRVSFDKVVQVMKQTGHDLPSLYKETSEGGLAKDYKQM